MPGLRDQFAHFYPLGDDAVKTAMKTGLVVPDTNVVLRLYEFTVTARDELFGALENLGNRLWIPYQVGHEVHRNRLKSIANQERFFRETRTELDNSVDALRRKVTLFQGRLALSKDDLKEIEDNIGALQTLIQGEVTKASKANEVRLKDRDSDKVLARLEKLFDAHVGGPMELGELEEALAEAARRTARRIPPGYMDADKDEGDPAGDYLVWRQLMTEAKMRSLPVVFITDDTKEDWYRIDQKIPLGARYELREELMREAGVPLLMITTKKFIEYAKKYLNAEFSEETVDQAKELPYVIRADGAIPLLAALAAVPPSTVSWADVFPWASANVGNLSDVLLEGIATGRVFNPQELMFAMQFLRNQLGGTEMERRVVEAVLEGEVRGSLSRKDATGVLAAMARELAIGSDTPSFRAVNPTLPILRDAFERALEVSPGRDDPGEVAQARRIIAMNLERRQVTPDDRDRAAAWMEQHNQWLHTQGGESQEEPSRED